MDKIPASSERPITLAIVTLLTVASLILMLRCASPEFTWDEADYLPSAAQSWGFLWAHASYSRHWHGPMAIYLAKLGEEILPASAGSLENRLRFFDALAGSLGIGLLYAVLRHCFATSRAAALAGSALLLLSVIRLDETYVIGPHDLMLTCIIGLLGLGYLYRERLTPRTALIIGAVLAFGAVSMSYVIPAALCWITATGVAGRKWFARDRNYLKILWFFPLVIASTAFLVGVFWAPGLLRLRVLRDFHFYLVYSNHPTLVGHVIYEVTPHGAMIYWLAQLELPILLISAFIIFMALGKAFRRGGLSSKETYLAVCVAFFLATALAAHLAGARNLLQFIGILCLATGGLFDEALGHNPRVVRFASVAVIFAATINLVLLSHSSNYTPSLATNGYRAFLQENQPRLQENARALVYGTPTLKFYSQQSAIPISWKVTEMKWTTHPNAPLPDDVQYVLMPAFVFQYMPADQPMRRIVADHWNFVWSCKTNHAWELRLYERPQTTAAKKSADPSKTSSRT